jgi:hypothetical protein
VNRIIVAALILAAAPGLGQENEHFNVILRVDYLSAEKTLELYGGRSGFPAEIAALRGSQIALQTTSHLAQLPLDGAALERALEAVKFNQALGEDIFRLKDARANVAPIRELLQEAQQRNFGQKVVSTVAQLFPAGTRVRTVIPVFVVAFGHQNIDAFVRRVVWRGTTPVFTGEGEGELTIVVNLAKAVNYGGSTDERFVGMLSVVAHEVFHAAFGVYKDGSPVWRQYYATHRAPIDQLLDLTHNEGIAYYLSLIQSSRGRLPADGLERARRSFAAFNASAAELLSPRTTGKRANDIIRLSNTSGYWDSYGAMTGMIVARQIDQTLGRQALMETIAAGPTDFFSKYAELMRRDTGIPPLSPQILDLLRAAR